VKLLFAGVRGSTPVSGPEFDRTGGHTSCVAILRDGEQHPTLLLDAGTGLITLDPHFDDTPFAGTILLTHLHWDHLQGLPFFRPADRDDARVALMMPEQGDARAVLRLAMAPPHFPIGPEGLRGAWAFGGLDAGVHTIEGFEVTALDIPHKGGRTFGYRVSDGTRSVAYLPDHGPHGPDAVAGSRAAALDLVRGVDVLVHGAPFVAREQALADCYGHATLADAIDMAISGGAGRLVLTHHGPFRTDNAVDDIGRAAEATFPREIIVAREGMIVAV
jgi:phosphoribosyl 1,2-cyclic phosphodiesterase